VHLLQKRYFRHRHRRAAFTWIPSPHHQRCVHVLLPSQQLPANAASNWTLYCKDPNGSTSTKYLDLQQKGTAITGHFKGPNQSGGVQGTIDVQHLVLRTKTREVLVLRGRVDGPRVDGVVQGNSFNGTFHNRGGTGSFQGVRSN
jgi:hypothetical protein